MLELFFFVLGLFVFGFFILPIALQVLFGVLGILVALVELISRAVRSLGLGKGA